MVWVPGTDEIPMSLLTSEDGETVTITVKERGEGSRTLVRKARGDLIGVRGPYGNGFTYRDERTVLMIAGGTGAVPILSLLRILTTRDVNCSLVLGAKTARELLYASEIRLLSATTGGSFTITTDDGTAGTRGLATDETERVLRARSFDRIYACGPETMLRRVIDLAGQAGIPAEAGLERVFKCGSGICGSCCLGPHLVCKDGPVFDDITLRELPEFGKSRRDHSGTLVPIR